MISNLVVKLAKLLYASAVFIVLGLGIIVAIFGLTSLIMWGTYHLFSLLN